MNLNLSDRWHGTSDGIEAVAPELLAKASDAMLRVCLAMQEIGWRIELIKFRFFSHYYSTSYLKCTSVYYGLGQQKCEAALEIQMPRHILAESAEDIACAVISMMLEKFSDAAHESDNAKKNFDGIVERLRMKLEPEVCLTKGSRAEPRQHMPIPIA